MVRRVTNILSDWRISGQIDAEKLHSCFFYVHASIVAYVALGWLITSRIALYVYTLLLPMIAMQWLLNGGNSMIDNVENLLRNGCWQDPGRGRERGFVATLLRRAGIRANRFQITTALCSLMLIFWVCAICRLMLVVAGQ